jgi:thioredoxin reductase
MQDVIIVGGGPAGLSAALFLGRCLRRVLVVDDGHPRNAVTRAVHGLLTRDGIAPAELLSLARADLDRYRSVELRAAHATGVASLDGGFELRLDDGGSERAQALVLATGKRDVLPAVEGLAACYGCSVFHCPYCDGYELAGSRLVAYAPASEPGLALELLGWTQQVTLCTDGRTDFVRGEPQRLREQGVVIETRAVRRAEAEDGRLRRLLLEDGGTLACDGLFFSTGQRHSSSLARSLGCAFDEQGAVERGPSHETRVPGVYVIGDATGGEQLVVLAAAEGARAAIAIHRELANAARKGRTS